MNLSPESIIILLLFISLADITAAVQRGDYTTCIEKFQNVRRVAKWTVLSL